MHLPHKQTNPFGGQAKHARTHAQAHAHARTHTHSQARTHYTPHTLRCGAAEARAVHRDKRHRRAGGRAGGAEGPSPPADIPRGTIRFAGDPAAPVDVLDLAREVDDPRGEAAECAVAAPQADTAARTHSGVLWVLTVGCSECSPWGTLGTHSKGTRDGEAAERAFNPADTARRDRVRRRVAAACTAVRRWATGSWRWGGRAHLCSGRTSRRFQKGEPSFR